MSSGSWYRKKGSITRKRQSESRRLRGRRSSSRGLHVERLETRRLLASDWRNPVDALDVNQDGGVAPIDALVILNDINHSGSRQLPAAWQEGEPRLDANGDGWVTPNDILRVINALNEGNFSPYLLNEQNHLANEQSVVITLGQSEGTRTYRFQVDARIDTTDGQTALEDTLVVYLVDPADRSRTLLDRGTPGPRCSR